MSQQPPSPYGNPGQFGPTASYGNQNFNPPPQKKKGGSTGLILGIVFGTIGLLIVVCGVGGYFVFSKFAVDSSTLVRKNTNDGVASMEVPENWMPITGVNANPEASLQMGNMFAETYAMVLSENKSDFNSFAAGNPLTSEEFSLEDYTDLILSNMTAPGSGMTHTPQQATTLNGMPAYSFKINGSFDGNPVVFTGMTVDGKRHYHQVLCWTLANREEANMPKLNQVLQSFKEN